MGLTNHTRPISHHITPLVITALGVDTKTNTHTHTRTYQVNKNDFKNQAHTAKLERHTDTILLATAYLIY